MLAHEHEGKFVELLPFVETVSSSKLLKSYATSLRGAIAEDVMDLLQEVLLIALILYTASDML